MTTISIVIPALNEEQNIPATLASIPSAALRARGYMTEVLVVDNGSTDRTAEVARSHGARVVVQPVRGYGNAYKAGFANSTGDIIVTGDADRSYPFDILAEALPAFDTSPLEFVSTDRLADVSSA